MNLIRRFRRRSDQPALPPPSEQELLITSGLRSLREATAREVMTPRVDVDALPAPVRFADVARAVRRSGHSHFPVYEEDLDRLIGVLFVKDLFHLGTRGWPAVDGERREAAADVDQGGIRAGLDVTERVREPYVVPESRSALEILADMRRRRRGFAVVVDEYGGFAGVLTIKDLVSELVGDLHDEFDRTTSPAVLRVDSTRFLVDGAIGVPEVREEVGVDIPDGEYVTLGGFLLDALGHIPTEGEVLERNGWTFRITHMDRRRIAKVVIEAPSATITAGGSSVREDGEPGRSANGK